MRYAFNTEQLRLLVSTLLEILHNCEAALVLYGVSNRVSTLLEILLLMCLVVVGF